jgi:hypothetical protein
MSLEPGARLHWGASLEGCWNWRLGGGQAACRRSGPIIEALLIGMIKAQVRKLQQLRQVLAATQAMGFPAAAEDEGAPQDGGKCVLAAE